MRFLKIIVFVFPVLFVCFEGYSQKIVNKGRFSIGVLFSPDYDYRYLQMENDELGMVQLRNDLEIARLGFSTGVVTHYQFKKRLAFESGIRFFDKGFKYEMDFKGLVDLDGNLYTDDPAIPGELKSEYHFYYLGIPVKLNYYFLRRKVNLFVSGGVSTDFFLSGKTKLVMKFEDRTEKETSGMDEDFNKVGFTGLAGFGLETNVLQKLQLRFEPAFRYSFTPVVDASTKGHLYSFGANIVLLRNF